MAHLQTLVGIQGPFGGFNCIFANPCTGLYACIIGMNSPLGIRFVSVRVLQLDQTLTLAQLVNRSRNA